MAFAFNFPKVGMILLSDFQSVNGKGPHGFGNLNHPPLTLHSLGQDAYKSAPVELAWPHRKEILPGAER